MTDKKLRQRPTKPRIEPVRPNNATEVQKELLKGLERSGRIWNVFATMVNHPELARDWLTFATYILRDNSLPPRDREILILRIGWLCHSEYEWAQHVRIGKRAGLSDDDVRRISEGPAAAGLSEGDRLLLQATDELHDDACLSESTWQALAKIYDQRQMMDLVFTVGQYNLVSMALNSFGVQLDEGLEGFAKSAHD
jgi:4-carboxymuconolactone decarboxylase